MRIVGSKILKKQKNKKIWVRMKFIQV